MKVYTRRRLRQLFAGFEGIRIYKRQLTAEELPRTFRWLTVARAGQLMGWNLIVKARKSQS